MFELNFADSYVIMMISELTISAGVLAYSINADSVTIEYFRGRGVKAEVPAMINDLPVTEIKKKAFFGAKSLRKIELPTSVVKIGEWAFASCNGLEEIIVPNKNVVVGAGIFKNCDKLKMIYTSGDDIELVSYASLNASDEKNAVMYQSVAEQTASLLALAAQLGGTGHLVDFERAGSSEWIDELDSSLVLMLAKDDGEGFSKMLLCGEEDYVGDDSNLEVYCSLRRKEKLRLVFTRLMNPLGIGSVAESALSDYLLKCMPDDTWNLVMDEHGEEQEYFDLLIKYDCITADNIAKLIESMGDKHSGMKAYLLRKKSEMSSSSSFFDDLDI